MSSQWCALILDLPPVASVPLVHGLSSLAHILGRAGLARNQVDNIAGLAVEVVPDVVGKSRNNFFKPVGNIQLGAEQATSAPVTMVKFVSSYFWHITAVGER